ncbi:zonular occludens toxin domain-containing protein [Nocardioides sp.]|uniref:zonular occludens toxin domain-containing protein n=1 Tax=Nocardioides sp. TaxID=35761 RepID=UPI002608A3A0|nr:zonular occludens toxin domain-containing protein [Nocardioides sp.]
MKIRPITAFVGMNGSGKTMSAVRAARRAGRRLVTNVPGVPDSRHFTNLSSLLSIGFEDSDVVFDEAGVLFSSRNRSNDEKFLEVVQQLRKQRARLFWTAPAYARADKVLREVTQEVVRCTSWFPGTDPATPWPRARFIMLRGYDAADFDALGQSFDGRKLRVLGRELYRASKWYDQFETLGKVTGLDAPGPVPVLAAAPEDPDPWSPPVEPSWLDTPRPTRRHAR